MNAETEYEIDLIAHKIQTNIFHASGENPTGRLPWTCLRDAINSHYLDDGCGGTEDFVKANWTAIFEKVSDLLSLCKFKYARKSRQKRIR
jgi:hypothetical protein